MDIKKILFKTSEIDVEKALPDAIIFFGKDNKIQWVNEKASELFETSKIHLLTSNVEDFIENASAMASRAAASGKSVIAKLVNNDVFYDLTAKSIEEGYVISLREASAALSLLPENEDDYKRVNRDKNCFLAKLANDFKSPLQSIVGFAQAMTDGLGGNMSEQQDKYIKIIKKNSSELMYFLGKLVELSKTEAPDDVIEYKTFDLINTVNSVVKFNEQLYRDKDVKWVVNIEEGMKNTVISSENTIKNILQNTIEAILKIVEMGEISVDLSVPSEDIISAKNLPAQDYIMLSVRCSSLMLSENDIDSIFDPYKLIDSPNRKNLLRAMTMASVKNMVQALNGIIWVESKALKKTGFNVIIPQKRS